MRRVPSTAGVTVAVHDLGLVDPSQERTGQPLLFVHAAGFHARAYEPLAAELGDGFHCVGIDLRGHGDTVAPDDLEYRWDGFADDVLAAVDDLKWERPWAFGHSSGGAALLLAEAARPGTFDALYCFEPIVWPDEEAAQPRAERLSAGAARRRATFPSKDDAVAHYASRPPLSGFRADALAAYVEHGFHGHGDGEGEVTLKCRPEVESQIYRQGVRHRGLERLGTIRCPVVLAGGADSDAITADVLHKQAAALVRGRVDVIDGLGHFGPFEDPTRVAEAFRVALLPC